MKCLRCGNEDFLYFYQDDDITYCRRCIAFGRVDVGRLPEKRIYSKRKRKADFTLDYPLTPAQKKVSAQILMYLQNHQHVLVYAATGAGKTELTMEAIQLYLQHGKKVGFAISRRQVVLEICERMKAAFKSLKVVAVCEGHTDDVDGDIIVCTMHQLYRYHETFDLLIMDEVDAFPYRGNDILEHIAHHACIGEQLLLTATPDDDMLKRVREGTLRMVELFQRPHGYPLIEPDVIKGGSIKLFMHLLMILKKQRKKGIQTLVFVPTIAMANQLSRYLSLFFKCKSFTSKTQDKEKVIEAFHHQKYEFLVCTTVLERGITIRGIYIVIFHGEHPVFNEASLIQMIGRVGRRMEMPTGKGWFLCTRKTRDISNCITAIKKMNTAD